MSYEGPHGMSNVIAYKEAFDKFNALARNDELLSHMRDSVALLAKAVCGYHTDTQFQGSFEVPLALIKNLVTDDQLAFPKPERVWFDAFIKVTRATLSVKENISRYNKALATATPQESGGPNTLPIEMEEQFVNQLLQAALTSQHIITRVLDKNPPQGSIAPWIEKSVNIWEEIFDHEKPAENDEMTARLVLRQGGKRLISHKLERCTTQYKRLHTMAGGARESSVWSYGMPADVSEQSLKENTTSP